LLISFVLRGECSLENIFITVQRKASVHLDPTPSTYGTVGVAVNVISSSSNVLLKVWQLVACPL
jgi:hypothetical protein